MEKFTPEERYEFMQNFVRKTRRFTKPFFKIAKKSKGKDPSQNKKVLAFIEENIRPVWKAEVEDKLWGDKTLEPIPEKDRLTYIFGAFIMGHSRELQTRIQDMYENLFRELEEARKKGLEGK